MKFNLYRYVGVGVTWVGLLNFLGVFIILGIGADDIFVILDFWRQSAEQPATLTATMTYIDDGGGSGDAVLLSRMHWTIEKSQYVVGELYKLNSAYP